LPHHFNTTNFHFHGSHVSPGGLADNIFRSMEPGQSYDIEINIPADHTRGTYWYHPHHHGSADIQISSGMAGTLIIEGEPLPMRLPGALGGAPLPTIRDEEVTNTRRLTLSAVQPEFPPAANYQEFAFLISGQIFDPNRVDQRIRLGAVEEWIVVNEHDNDHVFHIHTNPFQMVAINGEKLAERDWRDTVVVPRNGSMTFRSRFLDFTGRFVLHCHMMNHEELGMMQVVEVYAP